MARAMPFMLLACATAIAVLALRVWQLDDQLERAERRLGAQQGAGSASADPALEPLGLEPRLTALEKELRSLRDDLHTLEKATETTLAVPAPGANADPRQILSVVKKEGERIRDQQLDFARKSWTAGRKSALDQFAVEQKLQPEQKTQIQELLDTESDKLVTLLRKPDVLENPEQMAADWTAVLHDTDRAATGVLEPQQMPAWNLARTIERRILWPWLPNE